MRKWKIADLVSSLTVLDLMRNYFIFRCARCFIFYIRRWRFLWCLRWWMYSKFGNWRIFLNLSKVKYNNSCVRTLPVLLILGLYWVKFASQRFGRFIVPVSSQEPVTGNKITRSLRGPGNCPKNILHFWGTLKKNTQFNFKCILKKKR